MCANCGSLFKSNKKKFSHQGNCGREWNLKKDLEANVGHETKKCPNQNPCQKCGEIGHVKIKCVS